MEDIVQIFMAEAGDNLDTFEDALMKMESGEVGPYVQEAFRAIHNLKGSSAMVGFRSLSELAHAMEDRMDRIRSGNEMVDEGLVNLFFRGSDMIRELIQIPSRQEEPEMLQKMDSYKQLIRGEAPTPAPITATENVISPPIPSILVEGDREWISISVELLHDAVFKDIKAVIIQSNLSELGEVKAVEPPIEGDQPETSIYFFLLESHAGIEVIRQKALSAGEIKYITVERVSAANREIIEQRFHMAPMEKSEPKSSEINPPSSLQMTVIRRENQAILRLAGALDGDGVLTLMDAFRENPDLVHDITLDFAKLHYINSLGLGILVRLYKSAQKHGGRIRVLSPTPSIRELLETTKIAALIPIIEGNDKG